MLTSNSRKLLLVTSLAGLLACSGDSGDAPYDDSGTSDGSDAGAAASDANPTLPCEGDHGELFDSTNNGIVDPNNQIEPTNLVLSGESDFSICGHIDPSQRGAIYDDVDVYSFELSAQQEVRLHLQTDANSSVDEVEMRLFSAEGPSDIASGRMQGTNALISRTLPAGLYWVAVLAKTEDDSAPVGYRIDVTKTPIECDGKKTTAPYQESNDGELNRNNDTLGVNYSKSSNFILTPANFDTPEETQLVAEISSFQQISGIAELVSSLDDYNDRDSYQIRTGNSTEELSVILRWNHALGEDLDIHLFGANSPVPDLSFRGGATIGSSNDEIMTMAVLPNTDYWLWVGRYNGSSLQQTAVDYTISLCGSSF